MCTYLGMFTYVGIVVWIKVLQTGKSLYKTSVILYHCITFRYHVILLNINYLVQQNGACAYINGYCIVLLLERNIS